MLFWWFKIILNWGKCSKKFKLVKSAQLFRIIQKEQTSKASISSEEVDNKCWLWKSSEKALNSSKQRFEALRRALNTSKSTATTKICFLFTFPQNQISWIRRRDWHILSSGAQLYTNDERFGIIHTPGSNTWTLQIKFVQRRDNGLYECQVSVCAAISSKKTFFPSSDSGFEWYR